VNICLLIESAPKPVLAAVLERLSRTHNMVTWDPRTGTLPVFPGPGPGGHDGDVYLLKSRSPQARALARTAQAAGARVVNTPQATDAALDRWTMATCLEEAGVPQPRTWSFPTLHALAGDEETGPSLPWPQVVKSRTSARGDLVQLVRSRDDLRALLPRWGDVPVIAQEFTPNDGFDIKIWVIGGDLSAARRRSALEGTDKSSDAPIEADELPAEWAEAALRAGQALGLDLFGVDLLIRDGHPVVIDVNAFPGFQGARHPEESMLRFIERRTA
jgi:ribosomal protein S6--L-glutamate ligase